jgi:hypothetical protein
MQAWSQLLSCSLLLPDDPRFQRKQQEKAEQRAERVLRVIMRLTKASKKRASGVGLQRASIMRPGVADVVQLQLIS